jgi:hypothetical protein
MKMFTNKTGDNVFVGDLPRIRDSLIYIWWHAVAQLAEALRYEPEGRGFDSRWCHWIFSLT